MSQATKLQEEIAESLLRNAEILIDAHAASISGHIDNKRLITPMELRALMRACAANLAQGLADRMITPVGC